MKDDVHKLISTCWNYVQISHQRLRMTIMELIK